MDPRLLKVPTKLSWGLAAAAVAAAAAAPGGGGEAEDGLGEGSGLDGLTGGGGSSLDGELRGDEDSGDGELAGGDSSEEAEVAGEEEARGEGGGKGVGFAALDTGGGGGGGSEGGGGDAGGRGGMGGGEDAGAGLKMTAVECCVLPPLFSTAKVQMSCPPVFCVTAASQAQALSSLVMTGGRVEQCFVLHISSLCNCCSQTAQSGDALRRM